MNGVPTVTVTIDNTPVRMALDTGSTGSAVFEAAADRLDLPKDYSRLIIGRGLNGMSVSGGVIARDVRLAGVKFGDLPMSVLRISGPTSFDGLIGTDVLSRFDIDLDAAHGAAVLYAWRDCPDGKPDWPMRYRTVRVDYSQASRGMVRLPFAIGDHPLYAVLDTGAAATVISRAAALSTGATPEALAADRAVGITGVGSERVRNAAHRFEQVQVAGERYPSLPLVVRDPASLVDVGDGAFPATVNLGVDWLRTHRIWLSFASGTMQVARTAPQRQGVVADAPAEATP